MGKITMNLASKLTLSRDLSPLERDTNYKGRFKQVFSVLSANAGKTMLINLMGAVFFIPLLVVFLFLLQKGESSILGEYSFVGGLGFGYGATSAAVYSEAIERIFSLRQLYVLCYLLPCVIFAGIGMSGLYNCMRNLLWDVECKPFKHFFLGIKRHWYKFAIVFAVMGLVAVSAVYPLLEILKCNEMNVACNAGYWVWMIFSFILVLVLAVYLMVLVPMLVNYKFSNKWAQNFAICLKNAGILAIINFIQVFIVTILIAAPMALFFITGIFRYILFIVIAIYLLVFYALLNLEYSQYLTDNFIIYLYTKQIQDKKKEEEKQSRKEREKKAKAQNQKKKK